MECYVGIDVAKATLEIAVLPSGETWTVTNDDAGFRELPPRLLTLTPTPPSPRLRESARAARQNRHTRDARILAEYARRVRPEPRPLPDETAQLLDSLLTRRRQLIDLLTAEKNRLGFARAAVKRDLLHHIRWLEKRLGDIDHDLYAEAAHDPEHDDASPATLERSTGLTRKTVANEMQISCGYYKAGAGTNLSFPYRPLGGSRPHGGRGRSARQLHLRVRPRGGTNRVHR